MTRATMAPQKRPSQPACSAAQAKKGMREARSRDRPAARERRERRQGGDHRDRPTTISAGGGAAEDRAQYEQKANIASTNAIPAEEDGTAGGGTRGGDRVELLASLQPFLPVPGDGEE